MSSIVTTPKAVEFFRGTGSEECENFVRSIRDVAWREDKVGEVRWIANYASLHFAGKALRWHSRLPPDIQQDWSKLEGALLDHWPSPDDDDQDDGDSAQLSMVPTPAAAPNSSNNSANPLARRGVLKLISTQSGKIFYLGKPDSEGKCSLTADIAKALLVSVDVKANPHIIEESPTQGRPRHRYSWVGVHWHDIEPRISPGSDDWARITLMDSITMNSSYALTSGLPRITAWDISVGGDIVPTWFQGDQKTSLDIFINESPPEITIAADSRGYAEIFPEEDRGRIFFQMLN